EDQEPVELVAWRGSGRHDPKSVYGANVPGCILGEPSDQYFAATKEAASRYGPQVEQRMLPLMKPMILDSREKLGRLTGSLPNGIEEIANVYKTLRAKLVEEGYDGLIVILPTYGDCSLRGEGVKIIRQHFSITQAVLFVEPSTQSDSMPVQESAKGWPCPEQEGVACLEGLFPKERELVSLCGGLKRHYAAFCFVVVGALPSARLSGWSSFDTASSRLSGAKWAYRMVIVREAWPSSFDTARSGTPRCTNRLAKVCRRSWITTSFKPARSTAFFHDPCGL